MLQANHSYKVILNGTFSKCSFLFKCIVSNEEYFEFQPNQYCFVLTTCYHIWSRDRLQLTRLVSFPPIPFLNVNSSIILIDPNWLLYNSFLLVYQDNTFCFFLVMYPYGKEKLDFDHSWTKFVYGKWQNNRTTS